MIDPAERFGLLQQAGKRLREAITAQRWADVSEEARFAKALLTQIEHEVERLKPKTRTA